MIVRASGELGRYRQLLEAEPIRSNRYRKPQDDPPAGVCGRTGTKCRCSKVTAIFHNLRNWVR
jgi:hypothetical protein